MFGTIALAVDGSEHSNKGIHHLTTATVVVAR